MYKVAGSLLYIVFMLALAACNGGEELLEALTPPAVERSTSDLTGDNRLLLTGYVSVGDAYEVTSAFVDFVINVPGIPAYSEDGELNSPTTKDAVYNDEVGTVTAALSQSELIQLGDRLLFYRWIIEYRLTDGEDIATAKSKIYRTSAEAANETGNDVSITFGGN